jgi:hypothetical protein
MDTASIYVSLNSAIAVVALVLAWATVTALRSSYPASGLTGGRHAGVGTPPLTLGELLWVLGLMLAFYWLGRQLGYLLLGIG